MLSYRNFVRESKGLMSLAFPMMLGQVGQIALAYIDTVMVAALGTVALAGVSVGGMLSLFFFIIAMGLCSTVHVFVAHGNTEKNPGHACQVLKHGLWLVIVYSVVLGVLSTVYVDALGYLNQPKNALEEAKPYFIWMMWANLPGLMFRCFRNYMEALDRPWFTFWITIGALLLNVLLNWMFIFGNWGAPEMGAEGAGVATFLSRTAGCLVVMALLWFSSMYCIRKVFTTFFSLSWDLLKRMAYIGGTSLLQISFEFGYATMATLMMGWLGTVELAAQQVLGNYSAFFFMLPLSISFASTIRVGQMMGEKNYERAQDIGRASGLLGMGMMALVAVFTFVMRDEIAHWYNVDDPAVIGMASSLFGLLALFQVFDGLQVSVMGVLRGIPDMVVPLWGVIVSYWIVGIPLAYLMGFAWDMGAQGLWSGYLIGMVFATFVLTWRMWWKMRERLKVA